MGLASMVYRFFDKTSSGSGDNTHANNERLFNLATQKIAEELYELIFRKFKKRKVYSGFKHNIWGADLADVKLISKFNKGFTFLLCVIDIFSKYAWVASLIFKKGPNIAIAFEKILDASARKPNKLWLDKESEFHNSFSMVNFIMVKR